ncbi:MAG TPA: hypothetical protein VGK78_12450 [Nocardioides sp.]|uniref:hypothetical protein n=1 Tax=Nocardioides sp. TaxID=35761 RepID=UPI002F3E9C6C
MSSTLYTIGTALRRAHDHHLPVAVLVEGQWLRGGVVAVDGHGAILELDEDEHSVVRLERISAVRVRGTLPTTSGDDGHDLTRGSEMAREYDALQMVR